MTWYRLIVLATILTLTGCGIGSRQVAITSEPSGALILVNNMVVGETPLQTEIRQRAGDYNIYVIKAVKDDYMPMQKIYKELLYQDTVSRIIPEEIHFNLLKRQLFPIHITSEPIGAVVTLNGEVIGETPFTHAIKERIGAPRVFDFIVIKEGFAKGEKVLREFLPQDNGAEFKFPETLHFDLVKE